MIKIFDDIELLSEAAAELMIEIAQAAIERRGKFSVALSGGSTPRRLYALLAEEPFRDRINWKAVHIFWGDERCVPSDDPRSNARLAHELFLDRVPVAADHLHPILCDQDPFRAANAYEAELKAFFGQTHAAFDLILLGLGENAHTASLFPHSEVLREEERWVAAVYVAEQQMYRVTLTAPLINQAHTVVFLVSGSEKADVFQRVIEAEFNPDELPAQLIKPQNGQLIWLVDRAAAASLHLRTKF